MTAKFRHSRIFIGLSLGLSLMALIWPFPVPFTAQAAALAVLVALFGLPHGALDPYLVRKAGWVRGKAGMLLFLSAYIVLAAAAFGLWLMFPAIMLAVFLTVSFWHFSGDWQEGSAPRWIALLAGLSVLSLPSFMHTGEVCRIFALLGNDEHGCAQARMLGLMGPYVMVALNGGMAYALWRNRLGFHEASEIIAMQILAMVFSPLIFFILYFCGLHSPRHLIAALRGLEETDRRGAWRDIVLYTALPILGAGALWLYPGAFSLNEGNLIVLVFIGLFCLTMPHMILMETLRPKGMQGTQGT